MSMYTLEMIQYGIIISVASLNNIDVVKCCYKVLSFSSNNASCHRDKAKELMHTSIDSFSFTQHKCANIDAMWRLLYLVLMWCPWIRLSKLFKINQPQTYMVKFMCWMDGTTLICNNSLSLTHILCHVTWIIDLICDSTVFVNHILPRQRHQT